MKKPLRNTAYAFAILVCYYACNKPCLAYDDEGFQFWTTASASIDVNKDWKAKFEEELRLGDDGGNLYYQHSDLGFTYTSLAKWIDLGLNYRQIFEKDGRGEWRQENQPHFNVTLKTQLFEFNLSNRSRLEYRDRENREDTWRYRNKVTVKFPLEMTPLKLQPYVADEIFINFDKEDFNRNRFYCGFSLKCSKHIQGEAYYLWQSSESGGEWKDVDALGVNIKVYF